MKQTKIVYDKQGNQDEEREDRSKKKPWHFDPKCRQHDPESLPGLGHKFDSELS